ncbi:Cell division control protein 73 [Nakaseomyces bracarensis]|uniref:Cell division control protein 73 n=1 Tax=Nakaseomyces bracarensis TaxID=273131 RepID=A0ABR4NSS9_9SACH
MSVLGELKRHLSKGDAFELVDEGHVATSDISTASRIKFEGEELDLGSETEFSVDGKPVDLRVIIQCWIHRDDSAAEYLADCQEKKLTNISFLQRNDLLKWLSGESETSEYMDVSQSKPQDNSQTDGNSLATAGNSDAAANSQDSGAADPILEESKMKERVLLDHNSMLHGSKPVDFGYLIKDVELKLVHSIKSTLRSKQGSGKPGTVSKYPAHGQKVQKKDPIILIPSAASSPFTISNIKQFLEGSQYISPRDVTTPNTSDVIMVEKKFDRISKPIKFIIVNNTRMFTKPEYWDRVVAVFTTGHAWQFNNYQWNTPQELFQHCKGYYFHFTGDVVPQHVQQWNVDRVELDKSKRFKDVEVVRYFWNNLEKELLGRGFR